MNLDEYMLHSRGFLIREGHREEKLRTIYQVLYNANVEAKDMLMSYESLCRHWPIYTDSEIVKPIISRDEMKRKFEEQKRLSDIAHGRTT